jgi:hypothetical protein
MSVIDEAFSRDVRPYLDLIDSLRRLGVHNDLSLPQIAVMGDQVICGLNMTLNLEIDKLV